MVLARGCSGQATSAEGHAAMAMGHAEAVLSPAICPPGRARGCRAALEGSHLRARGRQHPCAPPPAVEPRQRTGR